MIENVNSVSLGKYADEASSMAHFDRIARESGLFHKICVEVEGYVIQPRLHTPASQRVKIDRVLLPSPKLIDLGWQHGPIGIEGKTSGKKIGPVISQAMDYQCSVFEIQPGYHVMLEWIFLWPFDRVVGDLESVMAQHRIGCVCSTDFAPLLFKTGAGYMIRFSGEKTEVRSMATGAKRGSR